MAEKKGKMMAEQLVAVKDSKKVVRLEKKTAVRSVEYLVASWAGMLGSWLAAKLAEKKVHTKAAGLVADLVVHSAVL